MATGFSNSPAVPPQAGSAAVSGSAALRHAAIVRVTHWIRAACLAILLMSGLQIFNAHPALYWGHRSDFDNPLVAMTAEQRPSGQIVGVTTLAGRRLTTTGVLGASADAEGGLTERGFPAWITVPSGQDLATARRWHFFFAWALLFNGLAYLAYSFASGHVWRDLVPSRRQLAGVVPSVWDHLRLRFSHGAEYNVLQKLSYLVVIFVLLPLMILTGLTMSPGMDAAIPQLVSLFGGRQSARTIHFIAAWALVIFVMVHVAMVLVSGVWNNMRSMITGLYVIRTPGAPDDPTA